MSTAPLSPSLLHKLDAYWRAANYLSVGQIYLYDNPLLHEPLRIEHVKPRLLGHWGAYSELSAVVGRTSRSALVLQDPLQAGVDSRPQDCESCPTNDGPNI